MFEQHRVAGHEGRRRRAEDLPEGEIPRHHRQDHPERLVGDGAVARRAGRPLLGEERGGVPGVVVADHRGFSDLGARLGERLAHLRADGTIDCIATDHAPHTRDEKSLGLKEAPFGVVGLETSFAVCYTKLVKTGRIELSRLIAAMSHIPRKIFNLEPVGLFAGSRADLSLIDLDREWIIDPEMFQSKGRSSPFTGKFVTGKVLMTISRGQIRWRVDC